tara:strand:- start:916 stop:1620 length:705 start_codon:yes stop_codon:yes gene_type:complete
MENEIKQILESLSLDQNETPLNVILSFVCCVFCSYLLKVTYQIYSRSVSSRFQFAYLLPILSGATFLVIIIIKSSIALSLGLVGALSIVRFRTPIKEPEELIYLFIAIALGVGFGANQLITTFIIFLLLVLLIIFLSKNKVKSLSKNHNLFIEIEIKNDVEFKNNDVINIANSIFEQTNLGRIDYQDLTNSEKKISIFLEIVINNIDEIDNFTQTINNKYQKAKISFFENHTQF